MQQSKPDLLITVRSITTRSPQGREDTIPAVWIEDSPVLGATTYLFANRSKSLTWLKKAARSLKQLVEFSVANQSKFVSPQTLFKAFVDALYDGTINSSGDDESGLYWMPLSIQVVEEIISHISQYSNSRYSQAQEKAENSGRRIEDILLNPYREATLAEKYLAYAAYHHKKNRAFLSHIMKVPSPAQVASVPNIQPKFTPPTTKLGARYFPEDAIDKLIEGFRLHGAVDSDPIYKRLNLRDVLITMLMHYAGLRISEVFHLFTADVSVSSHNPIHPKIWLCHPSMGWSPDNEFRDREKFLANIGLLPRNDKSNPNWYYAGWKNPTQKKVTNTNGKQIDQWYSELVFFPESYGQKWLELYRFYMEYQRIPPPQNALHPFLFTSKDGRPASIQNYRERHKQITASIGLMDNDEYSTLVHSHRHSMAMRLIDAGVDPLLIQFILRHQSVESQLQYHSKSTADIQRELNLKSKQYEHLHSNNSLPDARLHGGHADVDPQALFSGLQRFKRGNQR
ncbi:MULTISPECIES: gamma-mobile-trio recombinase GmtY [unclassified Agarivorans]|nr:MULTISPECIES: gamma-mobile-trio recombinase GmtY [unclassified Agarivorans]MDO6686632.1 gamma-mobile-trio recombinase GmtY [Agarivorans sp. 3_MG-2023]MDO6715450.1 gamma-mobile-trio recombinase GmtY [Agarivorans sp. 2_MG-2023]